jgi:hypothetical protein
MENGLQLADALQQALSLLLARRVLPLACQASITTPGVMWLHALLDRLLRGT